MNKLVAIAYIIVYVLLVVNAIYAKIYAMQLPHDDGFIKSGNGFVRR